MQAVYPDEITACFAVYTSQIIRDLSGVNIAIGDKKKVDFVLVLKGN